MQRLQRGLLLAVLGACCAACGGEASAPPAPPRARTTITDASGAVVAVLTPRPDGVGWHLQDAAGTRTGSLRVKDGRVSVKDGNDRRLGKVRRRDDGFKIDDGEDRPLLRLQRRDYGYRIKRGETEVIGRYRGARIELDSGVTLEARGAGARVTVHRAQTLLYTVAGPVPPEAAVFLGLSEELTFEQRVAAMIFVREVSFE